MINQNDIEIFIVIHNQDLVLDCENNQRFVNLSISYKYIFVGYGDISKLKDLKNIIIARDYKDNIEKYKYLVAFTAWYLLVKNNLTQKKYVCLLEYDTIIEKEFLQKTLETINRSPSAIVGYVPYSIKSTDFIENNVGAPILRTSLKQVYNRVLEDVVNEYIEETGDEWWPSTSNSVWETKQLENFVTWFIPIMEQIKEDRNCGHSFERAITVFSIINKIKNEYARNALTHKQLDSHKTQHNSVDYKKRFLSFFRKNK